MTSKATDVSEGVAAAIRLRARGDTSEYNSGFDAGLRAAETVALQYLATLSPPLPSEPGRVEIKVGDPDYKRFNLTLSDEARERLAQKPSAAPVDCVVGALPSLEVERPLLDAVHQTLAVSIAFLGRGPGGTNNRYAARWARMCDEVSTLLAEADQRVLSALSALPPLEDRCE
jgi:hypothetical protein